MSNLCYIFATWALKKLNIISFMGFNLISSYYWIPALFLFFNFVGKDTMSILHINLSAKVIVFLGWISSRWNCWSNKDGHFYGFDVWGQFPSWITLTCRLPRVLTAIDFKLGYSVRLILVLTPENHVTFS